MGTDKPTATAEEILKEVETRYKALLNSKMFGVVISDGEMEGMIYAVNDKFLNTIGYSRDDFDQRKINWSTITPPKYDRLDRIKLDELASFSVAEVFEKEYLHKKGHAVPVVVGAELVSHDPTLNITFVIDMTKQQQAEKEKVDMVATVGHELKTPLSILRVQAQLLAIDVTEGISPKKLLKALKEFDEHIKTMDDTLNHILMYNKPRMKKHATAVKEFDVAVTLKKVIANMKLLTHRRIAFDHPDRDYCIAGNETEIREVLINLISNAIKYSPDDTQVVASVTLEGDKIKVAVKDTGQGINKTDQKKVFQRSYQVRQPEGVLERSSRGLGLYLCREIMKKHGGKIEVESVLGQGSTFTCVFTAVHAE